MILFIIFWILSIIIFQYLLYIALIKRFKKLMAHQFNVTVSETLHYLFIKDTGKEPTKEELINKIKELNDFIVSLCTCPPHVWAKSPDGSFKCSKCKKNTGETIND